MQIKDYLNLRFVKERLKLLRFIVQMLDRILVPVGAVLQFTVSYFSKINFHQALNRDNEPSPSPSFKFVDQ